MSKIMSRTMIALAIAVVAGAVPLSTAMAAPHDGGGAHGGGGAHVSAGAHVGAGAAHVGVGGRALAGGHGWHGGWRGGHYGRGYGGLYGYGGGYGGIGLCIPTPIGVICP